MFSHYFVLIIGWREKIFSLSENNTINPQKSWKSYIKWVKSCLVNTFNLIPEAFSIILVYIYFHAVLFLFPVIENCYICTFTYINISSTTGCLIFVGAVCFNPHSCSDKMRSRFSIIKKKKKERQTRSHCVSGTLVCANCCCMPIGNRINNRAPCCLLEMHWHYKEHLCVAVRDWHQ